jgi:hypothetical protein
MVRAELCGRCLFVIAEVREIACTTARVSTGRLLAADCVGRNTSLHVRWQEE